jgi:thiaminase (transcriptional activator TenA)
VTLFARLKKDNEAIWNAYTQHEFVQRMANGTLPEEAFRRYLTQDYLFLIQFARAYALAAFKADTLADIRQAAAGLSAIVDLEMDLHVKFCAGWGLSEAEMEAEESAAETLAYSRFVLDRGMAGDLLDLHVALSPCIIGYAEIGGTVTPSANTPYKTWFDMYSGEEYQASAHAEAEQLEKLWHARAGEGRYAALSAIFATATRLESDFWQMGLDATG